MPLFMVKREVFEWIRAGRKTVELRKGRMKAGDKAVFQCGRNILRRKINRKEEGDLFSLLQDWKQVIPTANNIKEVEDYIKKLYGTTDGTFTIYQFTSS